MSYNERLLAALKRELERTRQRTQILCFQQPAMKLEYEDSSHTAMALMAQIDEIEARIAKRERESA